MLIKNYIELFEGKLTLNNARNEYSDPEQKGLVIKIELSKAK